MRTSPKRNSSRRPRPPPRVCDGNTDSPDFDTAAMITHREIVRDFRKAFKNTSVVNFEKLKIETQQGNLIELHNVNIEKLEDEEDVDIFVRQDRLPFTTVEDMYFDDYGVQSFTGPSQIITEKPLNEALKLWWGLQDIGTWYFSVDKQQKDVGFTKDPGDALKCFSSSNNEDDCKSTNKCRFIPRNEKCIPSEFQSKFPEIGAKINSKTNGEVFTLTFFLYLRRKKEDTASHGQYPIISVLETKNKAVVIFPVGNIKQKKHPDILGKLIPDDEKKALRKKITNLITNKKIVVLCGHSMGCSFAQMFGLELILKGLGTRQNLFIVGSAAYMWTCQPVIEMFEKVYSQRCKFFARSDGDMVDGFLFEGKIEGENISVFETTLFDASPNDYKGLSLKTDLLNSQTQKLFVPLRLNFSKDFYHLWEHIQDFIFKYILN